METIYRLIDPITGMTRYIGYTSKSLKKRLRGHVQESRKYNKTHKHKWIRKLLSRDLKPLIKGVKKVTMHNWVEWEKHYIKGYKKFGFDLVNGTEGGEGVTMTPETRRKIGLKSKGRKHTVETIKKMSLAKLGRTGIDCPNSKGLIAYNEKEEIFFHSAHEAELYFKSKGLKASKKNINACLRGSKSHGGKYTRHQVAGYKFKRK